MKKLQEKCKVKRAIFFTSQKSDFFRARHFSGATARGWEYSVSPDRKCVRQKVSVKSFFHSEHKNAKFFKTIFRMKTLLLLNDRKSQIPEMEFSSNT